MHAKTLGFGGISGFCVLAIALLLASCSRAPTYTVGGTVSGLTGSGLVLQNNGGNDLAVSANGAFTFLTAQKKGASYSVTVLTQPSGQSCTVSNGTGSVSANVTNVAVICVTSAYTIGGTVSGLTGTGLVLQNNGGNDRAISADGAFTFSTALAGGASYSVTVLTPPSGEGCSVTNGTGSIASANVTNVAITCTAPPSAPTLGLAFGVKELQFSWSSIAGATFYRLLENPDGGASFNQVATNITALSYNHTIPVHRRVNASYVLAACNAGGCTPSVALTLDSSLTQAIGYVKASNTGAGDMLGFSVALSGDGNTLAVGAITEASSTTGINSTPNESAVGAGAVYVFTNSAGIWFQQAYVKASNTGVRDAFGGSVALSDDGNTLAVGARAEDSAATGIGGNQTDDCGVHDASNCATDSGAVYVYTRNASTWSQQAYVKASNTESGDSFGGSVALNGDGNTLAVGAPLEASGTTGINSTPDESASLAGAVYIYTRSGTWSQQAYVKASNTAPGDNFGNSVALSSDGNTIAVGAPAQPTLDGSPGGAGAAYVYTRTAAGIWSQQAFVKASNPQAGDFVEAGDNFGGSVALSGDGNTLAVGAQFEDGSFSGVTSGVVDETTAGNAAHNAGAVYVYERTAGTWSQQAYVKASNTGADDNFGNSVALSGDGNTLAVGALQEEGGGTGIGSSTDIMANPNDLTSNAGAVYLY